MIFSNTGIKSLLAKHTFSYFSDTRAQYGTDGPILEQRLALFLVQTSTQVMDNSNHSFLFFFLSTSRQMLVQYCRIG
jgi:hypothetical protein